MTRMISDSTQAIALCDAGAGSRIIRYLNRAFQNLTGYAGPEATGKTLSQLLCPPGGQHEWEGVEKALTGAAAWRKTLPAARCDSTVFWADLHVYPLRNDETITHWVAVVSDVTDHLELHDALRRSDRQYRLLAENVRDLITVHTVAGFCRYASPSARAMLGHEPAELEGRSLYLILHPADRRVARQILANHAGGQGESTFVHRLRRKDGTYLWAETISKTYLGAGRRQPAEVVSVTRDISRRRDAQEKLTTMHGLLETVYHAVPIGLCLLDGDSRIIRVNPAFAGAFGYPAESLPGRAADTVLPPMALSRASAGQRVPVECECIDARGQTFPAELSVVDFDLNAIAKRLVTLASLRERRHVESRLRESSRLESLGTLAGGIAHDFNNKLAIVLAYASLLRDAAGEPDRIGHYADTIIEAGRRGADVVRQLQLFANTHETEVTALDLHELLGRTLTDACAGWPGHIAVQRVFAAADAVVTADPFQITLAVRKLLDNAREALAAGGTLTVRTAELRQAVFGPTGQGEQRNFLRISIEDTGAGMDASTRSRLFEPFFSHGKSPETAGVGLAVVYGIMRAHHGSIEVDSAPGQGTRVHLLFPRVELTPDPVSQLPFEFFRSTVERRTILLVEDEKDIGALWQEILPTDGWRVLWAADGEEALRLFRAHREEIALVFTDIGLPGVDGWQVAASIRSDTPAMPLLFASGAFRRGDRERGFAEPVAYLPKPYVPSRVLKLIRSLVPA